HANFNGRNEPIAADFSATAPMIFAAADPVEAEERRIRQIDRACDGDWADRAGDVQAIRAKAIERKISVDELIDQLRPIRAEIHRSAYPMATTVRASSRDNNHLVLEAAFCMA